MTAKTRHGMKAHRPTHGADPGSPHERMHRAHAMPNRPEGAPMSAATGPTAPSMGAPMPPPSPAMGNPMGAMAPPGAMPEPEMDTEQGDET